LTSIFKLKNKVRIGDGEGLRDVEETRVSDKLATVEVIDCLSFNVFLQHNMNILNPKLAVALRG